MYRLRSHNARAKLSSLKGAEFCILLVCSSAGDYFNALKFHNEKLIGDEVTPTMRGINAFI